MINRSHINDGKLIKQLLYSVAVQNAEKKNGFSQY